MTTQAPPARALPQRHRRSSPRCRRPSRQRDSSRLRVDVEKDIPRLHVVPPARRTRPHHRVSGRRVSQRSRLARRQRRHHLPGPAVRADHVEYDSKTGELTSPATSSVRRRQPGAHRGRLRQPTTSKTGTGRSSRSTARSPLTPSRRSLGQTAAVPTEAFASGGDPASPTPSRVLYTTGNPFLFTGRIVVKTGPRALRHLRRHRHQLPAAQTRLAPLLRPLLRRRRQGPRATNSTFRLLNIAPPLSPLRHRTRSTPRTRSPAS